jgi:hypothetical protein
MRRLSWLPLRRLPSLPRLWRRLRLRRWLWILLRVLGHLPPLLSRRPLCRHDRLTNIEMAGSDKVDPAIPCLLSASYLLSAAARESYAAQANMVTMASRVSNPFKKC